MEPLLITRVSFGLYAVDRVKDWDPATVDELEEMRRKGYKHYRALIFKETVIKVEELHTTYNWADGLLPVVTASVLTNSTIPRFHLGGISFWQRSGTQGFFLNTNYLQRVQ